MKSCQSAPSAVWLPVLLLFLFSLQVASAFYDPGVQRWLSRDPLGDPGSAVHLHTRTVYAILRHPFEYSQPTSLFSFVSNEPTDTLDPFGMDGQTGSKPGRLCTSKNCQKDLCAAKNLPEEGWGEDREKGKDPWRDIPNPGHCADSDGVATGDGVWKIPDNCTATLKCGKDGGLRGHGAGGPIDVECKAGPQVRPPVRSDGFPPNPYAPKPPPQK